VCALLQSFAEKPKTAEALEAMRVDTTVLGEDKLEVIPFNYSAPLKLAAVLDLLRC
jgi:hypothetical protein